MVNTNRHPYYVSISAPNGECTILSWKVGRWMGHRPRFGHIIACADQREALHHYGRALKLGLTANIVYMKNRVNELASLRTIYPGASVKRLQQLGFAV